MDSGRLSAARRSHKEMGSPEAQAVSAQGSIALPTTSSGAIQAASFMGDDDVTLDGKYNQKRSCLPLLPLLRAPVHRAIESTIELRFR